MSTDKNLEVCSFDDSPMSEASTQLGMTPLYSDTISSAYRIDYGAKYNSVLSPSCIVVHSDGSPFDFSEKRSVLRWLTGKRELSWLQIKRIDDEDFIPDSGQSYSDDPNLINILCRVTDVSEYKVGNETVGFQIIWTSNSPFAYSPINTINVPFEQAQSASIEQSVTIETDTDEQYDFIYPVIRFDSSSNVECNLQIENVDDGQTLEIYNIPAAKSVYIDNHNQIALFGTSQESMDSPVGDNFNLVWTRLIPGSNEINATLSINSEDVGESDTIGGYLTIEYRAPVKVGEL
jgi:hypothetical protein